MSLSAVSLSAVIAPIGLALPRFSNGADTGIPVKPSPYTRDYLLPNSPLKPILENTHGAVFLNITPAREGYALVVPKRQVPLLRDLTAEERHDLIDLVVGYQELWQQLPQNRERPYHFSIMVNDGKAAGQVVPHAHIHVVPIAEDEPLPVGGFRSAFRTMDPYVCEADKVKQGYPKGADLYRLFNPNVEAVHQFAKAKHWQSRFQAVG